MWRDICTYVSAQVDGTIEMVRMPISSYWGATGGEGGPARKGYRLHQVGAMLIPDSLGIQEDVANLMVQV